MKNEYVILVDEQDREIGTLEKIEAHRQALLHRAVSVFVFNTEGYWLIQQRAAGKYHSPLLWTNTCCTHPAPGETNMDAALRRLREEMGMASALTELFSFSYCEKLDREMTENEFDHVFIGTTDAAPCLNIDEAADYKYIAYEELDADVQMHPQNYTVWFRKIYQDVQHQQAKLPRL